MKEPDPKDYQAVHICRGCGCKRYVPKMAERFDYWFCHYSDEGEICWTMNAWKREQE